MCYYICRLNGKDASNMSKEEYKTAAEIEVAFSRIIGPLSIMNIMDSFKDKRKDINQLLEIIVKWAAEFQTNRNMSFITNDEILKVYERCDELKDRYLFDNNLGNESELTDEIVIWVLELMSLRKRQIEGNDK